MAAAKKKAMLQGSLNVDAPDRPQSPYSLSESGTFAFGALVVNKNGIVDSADKPGMSFTVRALDELKKLEPLGRGAGGVVHKCVHNPTNKIVALKEVTLTEQDNKHDEIIKELNVLYTNTCPSIVSFHGAFFNDGAFHIVLEFMDEGSLTDIMKRVGKFPEDVVGKIAGQILVGLHYLHKERHQVHRDIKPSNILFNKSGEAKLADFGVASSQLANSTAQTATFAGTVTYMAPERLRGEPYSYPSDIWSFGLSMAECLLGQFPYPQPKSFWDMVHAVDKTSPQLPADQMSPKFMQFVLKCLQKDPAQRPSALDLLNDPFIHETKDKRNLGDWIKTTKSVAFVV
mmetsp:Transcript_16036/g.27648  ORF Transcript_16036/g.27648 Transcript_16036/m.27648 type:complete len:343 (-) Transcript_16036:636-1664(-)|eukprot:CAMPEP_0196653990 /NCGR_PEP_ID=MMETSP1086-20130531/3657_1 /TAXON_ID=77921 /ORGANISM="Cyanoptyche  gloeocystis , Strain SAG4.97" /LENGTH=342 /DNA_ID=CAMNT_0041985477 /DNA_START=60 /DNA_END=1088 /DNA_ORIENTATION=+